MSVTNLNKVRKARARAQDKERADENAVKFGRSKLEKARDRAADAKAKSDVDAHKRDR